MQVDLMTTTCIDSIYHALILIYLNRDMVDNVVASTSSCALYYAMFR